MMLGLGLGRRRGRLCRGCCFVLLGAFLEIYSFLVFGLGLWYRMRMGMGMCTRRDGRRRVRLYLSGT